MLDGRQTGDPRADGAEVELDEVGAVGHLGGGEDLLLAEQ